jgi:predicted alpha/beta hydrolase family esterase
MASPTILSLPGWQSSGPEHWQSRWEALHGDLRVEQHDWMRPLRGDWTARLEEVVLEQSGDVVLVAHSLGCMLTAAWAAHSQNAARVRAALLVAPGDPETEIGLSNFPSFAPVVMRGLPFPSILVASTDDPFTRLARSQAFAKAWGSELVDLGPRGHINAQSGLGDWPEGRALLQLLIERVTQP